MTDATCAKCKSFFWREEGEYWKKLCIDCWKESRQPSFTNSSGTRETGIEERLRADLDSWRLRAQRAERSLASHICPTAALDLATLKRVRLLVHPDKHGNSTASNEVSKIINQMIREAS